MMQRSPMARMDCNSCVTTTKVVPRSRAICLISASSPAEVTGSRPAEGSSRNRIGGSSAMARAMPARLAMPPEISAGSRAAASAKPTSPSLARATNARASPGRLVCSSNGTSTLPSKVKGAEQRPRLPHHADAAQQRPARVALQRRHVLAQDLDAAFRRRVQADDVLQQRGLAGAGAAQDHEHLAAPHLEAHALEDRAAVEAGGEVRHPDHRLVRHRHQPSR
jgi:hypothetical protein